MHGCHQSGVHDDIITCVLKHACKQSKAVQSEATKTGDVMHVSLYVYLSYFVSCMHMTEEVREEFSMQAWLQVQQCCRQPATYVYMHIWTSSGWQQDVASPPRPGRHLLTIPVACC
jgi:hypothetical protein